MITQYYRILQIIFCWKTFKCAPQYACPKRATDRTGTSLLVLRTLGRQEEYTPWECKSMPWSPLHCLDYKQITNNVFTITCHINQRIVHDTCNKIVYWTTELLRQYCYSLYKTISSSFIRKAITLVLKHRFKKNDKRKLMTK